MLLPTLAVALLGAANAAVAPQLPLKKLRLYETGMAYFERSGRVDARGASLPIATGHLDDVLKTLVVLSTGTAHLEGVDFTSKVSKGMARAMAGLPEDATAPIGYADLLASLRGARVRVTTSGRDAFSARLVDVQQEELLEQVPAPRAAPETPPVVQPVKELVLLVVTDNAEVRRVRARDIVSVKPVDPAVATRLDAALDSLSAHGAQAERALHVAGTASQLTLGYIGEAPVWRTTYRLVLAEPGKGKSALQGWALLHNDTDEDWDGVRVELVNGRPDSFLYPLAAPRYTTRELVTPENELSTVPQLLDTTVDELWGDSRGTGGLGLEGSSAGGGGYGAGMGSIGTVGRGSGSGGSVTGSNESDMLDVGHLAEVPDAEGVAAGALFTYRLAEKVTLRARASALVPLFQKPVDAERVTWFSSCTDTARSAVRLVNETQQTLPAGPLSLFAEGGFAGEATIERLRPGERRFVQFGADLDVELTTTEATPTTETVKRLAFRRDELEEHYVRERHVTYALENRSTQPRSVLVALGVGHNAQVKGPDKLDFETDASGPAAAFEVKQRSKLSRQVDTEEGLVRRTPLQKLTSTKLKELAALAGLTEPERRAAKDAAERQAALEKAEANIVQAQAAMKDVDQDISRLRENLRALGGEKGAGSEANANPFVQRLLKAEDKLAALRAEQPALEADRLARAGAVRTALLPLAGNRASSAVSSR